jgi:2-keto-4-pentenoate hydratase/2-oxohepta-3-ene-1,7-dioic acid hydratase in catechol pathway
MALDKSTGRDMKLRRMLVNGQPQVQAWNDVHWVDIGALPPAAGGPSTALRDHLIAVLRLEQAQWENLRAMMRSAGPASDGEVMLPFEPRSYRDFMLYEQHVIQSSRGYAKRFMPGAHRVTNAFERITARPFPAFRPRRLFYEQPIYYMGNHLNFVSEGATISWPRYTLTLDYELELGFVIARPLLNAGAAEATAAIGGFVVFNDFSARDVQHAEMASGLGPQKSKHFCNAMSATIITADELLPHLGTLKAEVLINDKVVARCSDRGARYSLGEALAHVSQDEQLYPGEFFATGTWPNGTALENGHWLEPGDTISLRIDRVGSLTNIIGPRPIEAGGRP